MARAWRRWRSAAAVVLIAAGATTACGEADDVVPAAGTEPALSEDEHEPVDEAMTMEEFRAQAEPVCRTFSEWRADPEAELTERGTGAYEKAAAELREITAADEGVPDEAEVLVRAMEDLARARAAWLRAVEPHFAESYTLLLTEDGSTYIVDFQAGDTIDHDIPDELGLAVSDANGALSTAANATGLPACAPPD